MDRLGSQPSCYLNTYRRRGIVPNKVTGHGNYNIPPLTCCAVMLSDSGYIPLALSVSLALPAWHWLQKRSKNALPYPPGPEGYPVIGNLLDFPVGVPLWEGLSSVAKQHGMISSSHRRSRSGHDPLRCRNWRSLPQASRDGHGGSKHQ